MHMRAEVLISPRTDVAGHGKGLVDIVTGQHRGGQVLDGEHAGALGHLAGHSAGVVHIADGQAGQVTGDAHLAHLPDGQGEGIGAVGLAGIAVRVDAGIGHGFLIGSFLPEFNAHVQGSSGAGTKGEHAQQQYRKQGGAYALTGLSHGYLPFFAAKAALSGTGNTGIFNAKIAWTCKNVNLLREPFTKTLHIRNKKQMLLICWFLCCRQSDFYRENTTPDSPQAVRC